jgi:hypothetical protein
MIVMRAKALIFVARILAFGAWFAAAAAVNRPAVAESTPEGIDFFERKIRPVLVERCYKCHSAGSEKVKGGLLVDSREALLQGGDGGPALVPGEPDKSRLIKAIRYADDDLQMPPKEKLPMAQVADFVSWVQMRAPTGSEFAKSPKTSASSSQRSTNHWAFQRPKVSPIPEVGDKQWPKQPIDHFILAGLEERKLQLARPADKRTLIRRATFDLTGLPPASEEIDAFLNDSSSSAFAKVVDRLLDSRHFGERWGRHWLDVARYADSNGLEVNLPYNNAWRYRDYVVASFNQDKPFDQFIREQLAGDLLPYKTDDERFERLTATGFLVLGPKALAEPNQAKLTMDVADEQIDVTTRAFLGLTASCARCHDHKYDPIPTRDYYALAGIFKSTATLASAGPTPQDPGAPRWMERPLATADKAKAIEEYSTKLNKLVEALRAVRDNPGGLLSAKLPGIVVDNSAAELTGRWKISNASTNLFVDKDYVHDAKSDKGKMSAKFVPNLPHTGLYEVLIAYTPRQDRSTNVPVTIYSLAGTNTVTVNQMRPPTFKKAFVSVGTYEFQAGTNGSVVISNDKTKGFVVADAVDFVPIDEWKLEMSAMEQVSMKPGSASPVGPIPNLKELSPEAQMPAMNDAIAMASRNYEQLEDAVFTFRTNAPPPAPMAMAVQEGNIENCRINLRGDPEKLGDEVPRGFLTVAAAKSSAESLAAATTSSGRLELAEWVASADNPLTARVAVNRIWLHLFGKGLVDTPDNFGLLSEKPTHPELLDYLALHFVKEGWSFKKMIRTIMLTSAYQMSCEHDAKAYAKDPDNRHLWRMNRRRLEAEAIRDAVLAVSGQLDLTAGGAAMPANGPPMNNPMMALPQVASNRRSIYLPVVRTDVLDMFQVFDFADPHTISGKRHVTTAATQALFMMNSEFVQDQARKWAGNLLGLSLPDNAQRVNKAYLAAFGRPAAPQEIERALRFIESLGAAADSSESTTENNRLRAWQCFTHALLASTDFRFVD